MSFRGFTLTVLYLFVLFTPLLLVSIFRPQTDHPFIYEIGKNFALLGFTLLVLQFMLAARFKWVETPFGLDVVILFHRFMGIFATLLLMIHPLLLALGQKGWSLLTAPDSPWYIWIARIALFILLIHTGLSVLRMTLRLEFQRWRQLHNVLALLIILFGFVHSWYAGGDMRITDMQILWTSLLLLALCTYIYHRILRPIRLRHKAYRVSEILQESSNTWTVKMVPCESHNQFSYLPGQFLFLTLYRGKPLPVEEHPFTISSAPTQAEYLSVTIKQSGDYTAAISHTKPGNIALIHGPFGRFSYMLYPEEKDLVFIAGGIGITPFISMLRHMRATQADIRVLLLYANRTRKDIIFYNELSATEANDFPNLKVIHILSRPESDWHGEAGYLSSEKIKKFCGGFLENKSFYLCGPPKMIKDMINSLRELGVADGRIHFEKYSL